MGGSQLSHGFMVRVLLEFRSTKRAGNARLVCKTHGPFCSDLGHKFCYLVNSWPQTQWPKISSWSMPMARVSVFLISLLFFISMYFLSHSFCGSFGTRLVCTLLQSATWSRETLSLPATIPVRPIMFKYVPPLVIYYTSWSPQDHVIICIASYTCQFVLIYLSNDKSLLRRDNQVWCFYRIF